MRYGRTEFTSIGAMTEKSNSGAELRQVPVKLSYALTIHKCQGITVPISYASLTGIFGFGMPYTLLTRTPYFINMLFIGVPPKDVLNAMLSQDKYGQTCIDRKRIEILQLLQEPGALEKMIINRAASGEFDLFAIGESLSAELPEADRSREALEKKAQAHLCERLRAWYRAWADRLTLPIGCKAMTKVSEGFSYKTGIVKPFQTSNGPREWQTLAEALQGSPIERSRIQFYKTVAKVWMTSQGVDVLKLCTLNEACFPDRTPEENGRSVIRSYTLDGVPCPRTPFPQPPTGFEWGSGRKTKRPSAHATQPDVKGSSTDVTDRALNPTMTDEKHCTSSAKKRSASSSENVASQVNDRDVEVSRVNKRVVRELLQNFGMGRRRRQREQEKALEILPKRLRLSGPVSPASRKTESSSKQKRAQEGNSRSCACKKRKVTPSSADSLSKETTGLRQGCSVNRECALTTKDLAIGRSVLLSAPAAICNDLELENCAEGRIEQLDSTKELVYVTWIVSNKGAWVAPTCLAKTETHENTRGTNDAGATAAAALSAVAAGSPLEDPVENVLAVPSVSTEHSVEEDAAVSANQTFPPSSADTASRESDESFLPFHAPLHNEALGTRCLHGVPALLGYSMSSKVFADKVTATLSNAGTNVCYLNAALHVLARVPSIHTWAAQHLQMRKCKRVCVLCNLGKDFRNLTASAAKTPFHAQIVQTRASWSNSFFSGSLQHDAHEALMFLLTECEQVDYTALCRMPLNTVDMANIERNAYENGDRYSTPFWDVCGVLTRKTPKCLECKSTSPRYEILDSIHLSIPAGGSTIETLIQRYTGEERLTSPGDRCTYNRCRALHRRVLITHVHKWPKVLIVYLKRFCYTLDVPPVREKVYDTVDYEAFLEVDPTLPPYKLYGIVVHRGSMDSGHYTAVIRANDNSWYICDDAVPPKKITVNEACKQEAMILIYER